MQKRKRLNSVGTSLRGSASDFTLRGKTGGRKVSAGPEDRCVRGRFYKRKSVLLLICVSSDVIRDSSRCSCNSVPSFYVLM